MTIGSYAFNESEFSTNFVYPTNVKTTIGDDSFRSTTFKGVLHLPGTGSTTGILSIGNRAFMSATFEKEFEILGNIGASTTAPSIVSGRANGSFSSISVSEKIGN